MRTIECYAIDRIGETLVRPPDIECPLPPAILDQLLQHCPVVLIDPSNVNAQYSIEYNAPLQTHGPDLEQYQLVQPSGIHNRSFLLCGPGLDKPWQDDYGNRYGALTFKGNNFGKPGLMEHATATDGLIAWGLQESKIIRRVLVASEVLAARGISTERIFGLAEPKAYPWPCADEKTDAHTNVTLRQYIENIVNKYCASLPADQQTIEKWAEVTGKFTDMTYFISLRATDSPYRMSDMHSQQVFTAVIDHVNQYYLSPDELPYDPTSISDRRRYLTEFVAPRLGRYLAQLHTDLAHGFAFHQNLTALGGLVDLDSVHGEGLGLGDATVTDAERARDLISALKSFESFFLTVPGMPYVAAFMDSYFAEAELLSGSMPAGRELLGSRIAAMANQLLDDTGESSRQLAESIKHSYYDRYYADQYETPLVRRFLEVMFDDIIDDEEFAGQIDESFAEQLDTYAPLLISEHLDDLIDPDYDLVGELLSADSKVSELESTLAKNILLEIASLATSMMLVLPEVTNLNPAVDKQAAHDLIDKLRSIQAIQPEGVQRIIAEVMVDRALAEYPRQRFYKSFDIKRPIATNQDALRTTCKLERRNNHFPDQPANIGYQPGCSHLWLETPYVATQIAQQVMAEAGGIVNIMQLPEVHIGEHIVVLGRNHSIHQIVTDSEITMVTYNANNDIRLHIASEVCSYALIYAEDGHGQPYMFYLTQSPGEFIKHHQIASTPDDKEFVLF